MKKLLYLVVFTIFPLIIITLFFLNIKLAKDKQYKDWRIVSYRLENKNYRLLVADNAKKWERGLMYFRKLDGADGMVFNFPDKKHRIFWNKNTYIDLSLFWFTDDKLAGTSYLPSIDKSRGLVTVRSPSPVNKVIELKK